MERSVFEAEGQDTFAIADRVVDDRQRGSHTWACVKADLRRVIDSERSVSAKLGRALVDPGLHAVLLYRLRHWLDEHHLRPISLLLGYVSAMLTGAQISASASIGKGLAIYHPHGVVIGATAVLGEHCTLIGGNVIGQLFGFDDRPTIGDGFQAGAGAKILGRITIGHDVRVGPNTIVTRSLPDRVVFATAPGRIVSRRLANLPRTSTRVPHEETGTRREMILQWVASFVRAAAQGGAPTGPVTDSTMFFEDGLGLNSIEFLGLICSIEQKFGVVIDERDEEVFESVGSLVTFVEHRLAP